MNIRFPKIVPDDSNLVDSLIEWEGFNKQPKDIGDGKITLGSGLTDPRWHALYRQRGNVWSEEDNRMAVAEEVTNRRRWAERNVPNWDKLPYRSQQALLSYKYNYNFNSENSPNMYEALKKLDLPEVARQMNATSDDPKFKKGLEERRKREQAWFMRGVKEREKVNNTSFLTDTADRIKHKLNTLQKEVNVVSSVKDMKDKARGWFSNQKAEGGSLWDNLTLGEKAEMMKVAIRNGITKLDDIKAKYNEFAGGGEIPPETQKVLDRVNSSNANFVQRLKDPDRKSIPDWEHEGYIATHKLGVGTDERGNNYIYPEVQEINGKLVDFTRPPYLPYAGMVSAEERGDTVRIPRFEDALKFTETYKQYYPKGKTFSEGGNLYPGGGYKDSPITSSYLARYEAGPIYNNYTMQDLRRRLYDHISPVGYNFPLTRYIAASLNPSKVNEVGTKKDFGQGARRTEVTSALRDDLWAEYLQIPKEERHKILLPESVKHFSSNGKIEPTNLRPVNAEDEPHFKLSKLHSRQKLKLIDAGMSIPLNSNKESGALYSFFGRHTVGRGHDNKGEYVSYYDKWDLAPFLGKGEDQSFGIGKPVHLYDRVYLDDFYQVPKENRGNYYVPEVVIEAPKVTLGGSVVKSIYEKALGGPIVQRANK